MRARRRLLLATLACSLATGAPAFQAGEGAPASVQAPAAQSEIVGRVETVPAIQLSGGAAAPSSGAKVYAFRGVPYALPPIGERRWRAPEPIPPGSQPRIDASRFASPCVHQPLPAQLKEQGRASSGFLKPFDYQGSFGVSMSENCLFLNVWTPEIRAGARLPVMVWIHGGGFVRNSTLEPMTEGGQIAARGAVLVSFEYRLGGFGFFSHPSFNRQGRSPANFGLLDEIAALRWVKANIAVFGGDPDNVTIFGSSAGGASAQILMSSPAVRSEGLFRRVISESGGGAGNAPAAYGQERGTAETLGAYFYDVIDKNRACTNPTADARLKGATVATAAATLGVDVALRECVGTDQVINFFGIHGQGKSFFERRNFPYVDGAVVDQPNRLQAFRAGEDLDIPMIIGSTSYEQSVMGNLGGLSQQKVDNLARGSARMDGEAELRSFAETYGSDAPGLRLGDELRDIVFGFPAYFLGRLHAARNRTFVYYLSYTPPAAAEKRHGLAGHSAEIPYVFGWPEWAVGVTPSGAARVSESDVALSRTLMRYWINFAAHGDPNKAYDYLTSPDAGLAVPAWPAMTPTGESKVMTITNSTDGKVPAFKAGPHPMEARFGLMARAWLNGKRPGVAPSDAQ